MNKYKDMLVRFLKIYLLRDRFLLSAKQWFKDNGDNTLRLDYNLDYNSVVFDIGGFEGTFSEKIYQKYKAKIYIFEPVNSFYTQIDNKFKDIPNIKTYNFGLSSEDQRIEISLNGDASSTHALDGDKEKIKLCSIIDFIEQNKITKIDLMKINIEGGEFDILPTLLEHDIINSINNLQIQFHTFVPNAENQREAIRKKLLLTHTLTYDYYFIWENWKLKE